MKTLFIDYSVVAIDAFVSVIPKVLLYIPLKTWWMTSDQVYNLFWSSAYDDETLKLAIIMIYVALQWLYTNAFLFPSYIHKWPSKNFSAYVVTYRSPPYCNQGSHFKLYFDDLDHTNQWSVVTPKERPANPHLLFTYQLNPVTKNQPLKYTLSSS